MLNVVIMVSGGGTNLQAIIDAVEAGTITNTRLAGVISNNKNAYALERAAKHGIPVACVSPKDFEDRGQFNQKLLETVDGFEPDLVVLAGFLVVIPPEMTAKYRNRMINIHPSLIPSFCGTGYYGLKVHEAALARGVKVAGATVHFVDEGTDTGPIILQKAVEVRQGDTPKELQRRVMEQAEWKILPRAIDLIANGKVTVENGKAIIEEPTRSGQEAEMNVLIVGSGGREHAIAASAAKSPKVKKMYCAPGNAGIAEYAECVPIGAMEFDKLTAFAKENRIDLVIVGMDDPLVGGLVDELEAAGIRTFGPRKNAAILEGSKAFSKNLMKKYNIPTAAFENFTDPDAALAYLETAKFPIVLKADGLDLSEPGRGKGRRQDDHAG